MSEVSGMGGGGEGANLFHFHILDVDQHSFLLLDMYISGFLGFMFNETKFPHKTEDAYTQF